MSTKSFAGIAFQHVSEIPDIQPQAISHLMSEQTWGTVRDKLRLCNEFHNGWCGISCDGTPWGITAREKKLGKRILQTVYQLNTTHFLGHPVVVKFKSGVMLNIDAMQRAVEDKRTKLNDQQLRLASLHVEQPRAAVSSPGKANMKFQIPQTANPGDQVTVISPSGQAVTIKLPPVCQSGQWITVQYDLPQEPTSPPSISGGNEAIHMPPPPPFNTPASGSREVMTFQVPMGSVPGGPCAVITPTGKTVMLTLPTNCSVGQWITIQYTG